MSKIHCDMASRQMFRLTLGLGPQSIRNWKPEEAFATPIEQTLLRYVTSWEYGPMRFGIYETNPQLDPPDHIFKVMPTGQETVWFYLPERDWKPCPQAKSEFVLFGTDLEGLVLLGGFHGPSRESLLPCVEHCHGLLELYDLVPDPKGRVDYQIVEKKMS